MKKIFILSIIILLASCYHSHDNSVIVSLENSTFSILDSVFSKQEFISLETKKGGLIGLDIKKVIRHKNSYYILNRTAAESELLVYDLLGNFKFKIGTKGKGAEEYRYLSDFFIDKKNDEIYLHLGSQGRFYIYSLENVFLRSKKYVDAISFSRKTLVSDSLLYCMCDRYESPYCNFIIYNYYNDIVLDTIYNTSRSDVFILPQTFNLGNDKMYYVNGGDSIIKVESDSIIYVAQIVVSKEMSELKKRISKTSSDYNSSIDQLSSNYQEGNIKLIAAFINLKDYYIIQIAGINNDNQEFEWGIYNINQRLFSTMADINCGKLDDFKDALRFINKDEEECYALIEPYRLNNRQLSLLNTRLSKTEDKRVILKSDNPILIRLYNE